MTSEERLQRIAEADAAAEALVRKGWNVERIVYVDETDQPFRVALRLFVEGRPVEAGVL